MQQHLVQQNIHNLAWLDAQWCCANFVYSIKITQASKQIKYILLRFTICKLAERFSCKTGNHSLICVNKKLSLLNITLNENKSYYIQNLLLVLLSWSRSVSSVPFLPKKDFMSLSSYQLRDGIRSPPMSGWPHMIFEKAWKLSLGSAVRFCGDRRRRAALISTKLEREENWTKTESKTKKYQTN